MELGVKIFKWIYRLPALFGFISFLLALISLAGINVGLLIKQDVSFRIFTFDLPFLGFFLGVVGLFTEKRSRLFAIWGLSLCIFIFVFTFLMIGLSWAAINPKP